MKEEEGSNRGKVEVTEEKHCYFFVSEGKSRKEPGSGFAGSNQQRHTLRETQKLLRGREFTG